MTNLHTFLRRCLVPMLGAGLVALSLNHAAVAHEHGADASEERPAHAVGAAPQAREPVLPPLAARFAVGRDSGRGEWYLVRTGNHVETANTVLDQNEIWERSAPANYLYTRIYHRDQKIVEYVPGELKARNVAPDWQRLACVVSPQSLAKLRRIGEKKLFGQTAVHYRGRIGQEYLDLWWLEQSRLPAQLQRRGPQGRIDLRLKELHESPPAAWPLVNEARIAGYQKIDASDFGDKEYDPFVARIQAQDGHGHAH